MQAVWVTRRWLAFGTPPLCFWEAAIAAQTGPALIVGVDKEHLAADRACRGEQFPTLWLAVWILKWKIGQFVRRGEHKSIAHAHVLNRPHRTPPSCRT